MKPAPTRILTINGGSSSIKFALFQSKHSLVREFSGKIDRIGLRNSVLEFHDAVKNQKSRLVIKCPTNKSAANFLIAWLEERIDFL